MKTAFLQFVRDERGATAIEYGIIAGMMAVILVTIFSPTGVVATALTGLFDYVAGALPSSP